MTRMCANSRCDQPARTEHPNSTCSKRCSDIIWKIKLDEQRAKKYTMCAGPGCETMIEHIPGGNGHPRKFCNRRCADRDKWARELAERPKRFCAMCKTAEVDGKHKYCKPCGDAKQRESKRKTQAVCNSRRSMTHVGDIRKCQICGAEFATKYPRQVYCKTREDHGLQRQRAAYVPAVKTPKPVQPKPAPRVFVMPVNPRKVNVNAEAEYRQCIPVIKAAWQKGNAVERARIEYLNSGLTFEVDNG